MEIEYEIFSHAKIDVDHLDECPICEQSAFKIVQSRGPWYQVECMLCGCRGGISHSFMGAIDSWNKPRTKESHDRARNRLD